MQIHSTKKLGQTVKELFATTERVRQFLEMEQEQG